VIPDGAYIPAEGMNGNGQRNTQGRVTSTYYSPTLKKGIAMGLLKHGPSRMGEVVEFTKMAGGTVKAKVVNPVFYGSERGEAGCLNRFRPLAGPAFDGLCQHPRDRAPWA
jgi:sarcosine oxidase subunit alpha